MKSKSREKWILPLFFFFPTVTLLGTAGVGFSRYYLFCSAPLILWAGVMLTEIWRQTQNRISLNSGKAAFGVVLILVFFKAAWFHFYWITQPQNAPLIERDRYQFVTSQFSGYGIPEAIDYLKDEAKQQRIVILTTTNWGNPADAVYAYLGKHPNIAIYSAYWVFDRPLLPPHIRSIDIHQPFTGKFIKTLDTTNLQDVYFIRRTSPGFKRNVFVQANPNFHMVRAFKKPDSAFFVEIYKRIQ